MLSLRFKAKSKKQLEKLLKQQAAVIKCKLEKRNANAVRYFHDLRIYLDYLEQYLERPMPLNKADHENIYKYINKKLMLILKK